VFSLPLQTLIGWYSLLVVAAGVFCLALSVSNILFLRLNSRKATVVAGPKVSVLIPARDEEQNIRTCLDSLLVQTYANYEIIVFDDMSTDETFAIVSEYVRRYPNVRVIKGTDLPEDWYGKPHAMQQLAQHAHGEYLLFTDADTVHRSDSISWAVTNMLHHDVSVLSGSPHHTTETLGEALVVPNMYLNLVLLTPLWLVPVAKSPWFSHTVGQYMLFKAEAFRAAGGWGFVRRLISEDIHIGRWLKRTGHKIIFLDAQRHVTCRMYVGFRAAANGLGKNIYDFFGKKLHPILILSLFVLLFLLFPVAILAARPNVFGTHFGQIGVGAGLFFVAWLSLLYDRGAVWYAPLMYPIHFVLILGIAWKSVFDNAFGRGYLWKGRFVK
jgi:chlorobactene glucosyltransferase